MNSASAPAVPDDERPALERARPAARADEAELAAIYETRRGELLALLVGMTRDLDEAEDLLQETFVTLVREARAGRMPDDVRPWLYRVAANTTISRRRRFATWTRLVPRLLDLAAVGSDGQALPGWPMHLARRGAEFWSVVVGSGGTVYALAIEPEAGGESSATILAMAKDGTVRSRTTVVEP